MSANRRPPQTFTRRARGEKIPVVGIPRKNLFFFFSPPFPIDRGGKKRKRGEKGAMRSRILTALLAPPEINYLLHLRISKLVIKSARHAYVYARSNRRLITRSSSSFTVLEISGKGTRRCVTQPRLDNWDVTPPDLLGETKNRTIDDPLSSLFARNDGL